jgi:hypothetical protein
MSTGERVRVRWTGRVVNATVVRRYKNGNLTVDIDEASHGGRHGTVNTIRVKVEPWQVVEERGPGRPSTGTPVQVRIPPDVLANLDKEAAKAGVSRAEFVRRILVGLFREL